MRTILCYRRKSLVRQDSDLISPARQMDAVNAAVTLLGPEYHPEWYEDIDGHRSGRTEEGRPGWLSLKRRLNGPGIGGVACYSLSRIYRNVREFLCFVDELNRRGLRLIVVREAIDTGTATGMAINTILMALYQLESDLASERMTETIEYKRRVLHQHWGTVPFGTLRNADQQLEPDPETVETLRRLFTEFGEGTHTYDSLCDHVNELDLAYYGRDGEPRPWTRDDVRRTLAMWRLYAGHLTLGQSRDDDELETIRDAHTPILPRDLCRRVSVQLELRRKRFTKRHATRHMLSGLAYCATCGRELSSTTRHGVRRYRHRGAKGDCPEVWLEAEPVEARVIDCVSGLWTPEVERGIAARVDAILADRPGAADVQDGIRRAEDRLERIIDLYLDGHLSRAEYLSRSAEIERETESLRDRRREPAVAAIEAAADRLRALCAELPELTMGEQREQLLAAFARLTIHAGDVHTLAPAAWLEPIWSVVRGSL